MAKKSTKRHPSDLAPVRPPSRINEDMHTGAQHTLVRIPLTPEMRADALAYMLRRAPDLVEVLGLAEPTGKPAGPYGIACDDCGVASGSRCVSQHGNEIGHPHAVRRRKAAA